MARKKKPRKEAGEGVVDFQRARAERILGEVETLAKKLAESIAETVGVALDGYHAWEKENAEHAVRPYERLEMIRLGFVGPGGFDRCQEDDRVPRSSYPWDDPIHDHDRDASHVLMCPLMEARRCEPIWSQFRTPPCYLLLLEVYDALGRGADDWKVREVLDDFGKYDPEEFRKNFVRADRLIREAEKARAVEEEGM